MYWSEEHSGHDELRWSHGVVGHAVPVVREKDCQQQGIYLDAAVWAAHEEGDKTSGSHMSPWRVIWLAGSSWWDSEGTTILLRSVPESYPTALLARKDEELELIFVKQALMDEEQRKAKGDGSGDSAFKAKHHPKHRKSVVCFNCGIAGHYQRDCCKPPERSSKHTRSRISIVLRRLQRLFRVLSLTVRKHGCSLQMMH